MRPRAITLYVTNPQHAGSTVAPFSKLPILIGRANECDCVLRYPFVSRRHATLDSDPSGRVILSSVEGSQGVFRSDGTRIEPPIALSDIGGEFRIGELTVTVVIDPAAAPDAGVANLTVHGLAAWGGTPVPEPVAASVPDGRDANLTVHARAARGETSAGQSTNFTAPMSHEIAARRKATQNADLAVVTALLENLEGAHAPVTEALASSIEFFAQAVERELRSLSGTSRRMAILEIRKRFPLAALTPAVSSLLGDEASDSSGPEAARDALEVLSSLAKYYGASTRSLTTPAEVRAFGCALRANFDGLLAAYVSTLHVVKKYASPGMVGPTRSSGVPASAHDLGIELFNAHETHKATPRRLHSLLAGATLDLVCKANAAIKSFGSFAAELSPSGIEATTPAGGWFRRKDMWRTYCEKFAEFEEQHRLAEEWFEEDVGRFSAPGESSHLPHSALEQA